MTLWGQPETILEVDGGSIFVNFSNKNGEGYGLDYLNGQAVNPSQRQETDNNFEDQVVPNTPSNDRESLYLKFSHFSKYSTRDALASHPLSKGTPLTIKKNKVARIQICEIRFNRTRASLQSVKQQ